MDEQALNDAYNLFTRQGYNGTIDQFKKLISTNTEALNDSYEIFRSEGYNGEIDNYKELIGLKKKAPSSPDLQIGGENLQDGFDFSPLTFEAPSVLTPKKQKEYIAEQKGKPTPVVETPTPDDIPKGFQTYQAPNKEDEQGLGLNILSSLNKGFYQNLIGNPIKGVGTLYEKAVSLLPRQIRSETGKGIISDSLIDFGNYFNRAIDEISPQDKEFKNSLTDQFAQAFGQVASTILTAGAGGAGSIASKGASMLVKPLGVKAAALAATKEAGKQIVSPVGISSALTMGQSEYERAKQAGATDEQAFEAFYKNAITGSVLETIPVMQFMKRFNNATQGGIINYIKTKGVAGLTGGVEEMTTEVLQGLYANKTAQEIYNENQNIFEGLTEAGGVGFGVGFLLNAMGANVRLLRKQGKNDEANALEKQIETLQSQAESGPPPIYKINGLKIESPQIVNDMIERMSVSDLSKINIDITNDPVLKNKLQDKIVTSSIMEQVREANPELNEPSLKAITELEKQLTLLEGNKTQTGKDKAAAIRGQIKNIQENQLQEEAVAETVVAETPEIAQQRVDRIAEIETTITNDDAKIENPLLEGIRPLLPAERTELQTELETLKSEQDAIQEQTAGQVPVLTEAGVSQEVPGGLTQTESEIIAQKGVQEEVNLTEGQIRAQEYAKLSKLEDDVILAKKEIVRADDTEAAIEEYNKAKKAKEDYQAEVDQRKEKITKKINVQKLVQDETDSLEQSNYEYKELYDKDPRLAALQNAKDMLEFVESGDLEKAYIEQGQSIEEAKNNIKESSERRKKEIQDLEEDIKESPIVSLETQAPKFVRDISALITPATVRAFSPLTKRIQKLSLNYDKLVKQYAKKKDPKILAKIKDAEAQILNDAKQEIIDAVAKVNGVAVQFKDTKRGLWDGSFEPSFNMILSISPQANTEAVSDLLFDFAEKYSQDAFILESDSELQEEWVNGNIDIPLSEIDSNGLTNYPQIIYTFAEQITDEQVADLSVALENNGIGAFNINNNELQVSVIFTEEQDANLTKEEQYEEREKDFDSKSIAAAKAVGQILGRNGEDSLDIRIKKSSYQGATNEGTADQTRQFNKSDVLKAFKESTTKVEKLAVELAGLRQKEIDLQAKGKKLSPKDKTRFDELVKKVQPVVQRTFETNKKLYEDAKTEIEGIAQDAISQVDASISPFPIKKPERASVKAIRWYNAFTEKLGDGARVNIVVDTDTNAEKVFKIIDKKYPGNKEVRRIRETTALGYPKRLIEIVTSNGTIAEIQVITNEAYLAKDGIKGFTGDEKQKSTAKQKLDSVRSRLGWNIPDGLGHYFYEIQRDTNVDDNLRDEAERLSDLYYDAFTNPKSKLSDSFMKDVMSFKEQVDAADKSEWDTGNKGIAPQSLVDYNTPDVVVEEEQFVPLTVADIEFDVRFSRENSSDVVEDEREGDNGRTYTYLSEVETPVSDVDGNEIGYLVKMVDEDKNLTFEARNENGSNLSKNEEGFDTLGEAKQALLNNYNKEKKKEFDREAKAKAKEKAKEALKEAAKKAKAEAKKPVVSETIDDLLDLDVADQDNLDRIFNALDRADKSIGKALGGANEAMLAIPLNVVRIAIKTLKGLVKGGMLLRDAIKKVAADNDISQDTIKDIINIAPIQDSFYALMEKVDALIARQKARGIQDSRITSNIDTYIRTQDEYLNANDAQKKIIEREARGKMGAAPKRAVSIGRVLGALKDITNISRAEKLKVISQIRQLSKDAAKDLAKEIRAMASSGRITANQAANIIARFGKVNMLSEISVSKFVDYMAKVFANAEYAAKLSAAKNLKKDISKLSKNKEKNANLRDLGSKFIKIDPTMVEDIDAYNDMASKIKEAIKGSTIRGAKVKFADTVNIENATEYINKTIEAQDEMMRQQKVDEIQELMGVDVSDLSYDDMMQLLDSKEPITKYNEGIIRSTIQKMFNIYSTLIDTTLDTGKDPFTDEDIDISKNKRDLIKRFMDMDLTVLSPKQALQAVDALANFFQNRSTAKMEAILAEYTGNANAKKLVKDGIVAQPLKKYWSPKIGRFLGEQTTNLNILFERMFKGFSRGGKVEDASGVTMLKNNKSMAQRESNNIVEKYIAQFYNKTANGEAYNSEYNSTERGLAAFMMRNIIGTEKQMQAEFNRRKGLVEQSIKVLSEGNEKERAKAELYQTVYDNLIGPSKSFNENQKQSDEATNIQQVKDRVDKVNLEGIDFWNKEWADKYEQLSDVSENIYNKVLDKDLNYTPDKFVKLSTETGTVELSNDDSAFHNNNGTIYKKETGVLMTAVKPDKLPTNPKSGETSRYIDLSFDKNNSNSMYDALVDIGTAGPIRQIEGFLNSPDFKKIVPKAEDAKILKERIQLYVGNIRNKNPYSNDELSSMVRGLNRIASIGVGQALGGVFQPVKQMIPVAMNTLINAGNLDMGAIFDSAKNSFINRSGFAISNRGIESQAQVESLNKLIDEASKTKGEKLIKNIEKLNNWWLEKFLVKPDVFIARASWMTYYEQSLKKQGIDTKGIDYNTHEVNQEAAEYAQRMVDRQQNVSDSDLAGKMFSNKEATNQLFVKMLMPFASFRMNQSARFGSDLSVLSDKTSTPEDKKIAIKSLSGFAVEMATFKMIAAGSAILLGSASKWLMGDDEDEEEYKKRVNNIIKGQVTSSFTDVVSPLPILDKAFQEGGNFLTETMLDIPKESVFSIYGVPKQDYIQSLGLFGITAERAGQLYDITKLSTTGKYVDEFGKEKTISEEKQKALSYLIPPAILSNVGLAPVEVNSIVRNSIKNAKKGTSGDGVLTRSALERWASSIDLSKMSKVAEFIKSKKEELSGKGDLAEKREFRKELEKDLLGKYEDKAQMRGADPELYKKNFGAESDWVKKGYATEEILETKFNTILNKKKNLIKIEELKKQK